MGVGNWGNTKGFFCKKKKNTYLRRVIALCRTSAATAWRPIRPTTRTGLFALKDKKKSVSLVWAIGEVEYGKWKYLPAICVAGSTDPDVGGGGGAGGPNKPPSSLRCALTTSSNKSPSNKPASLAACTRALVSSSVSLSSSESSSSSESPPVPLRNAFRNAFFLISSSFTSSSSPSCSTPSGAICRSANISAWRPNALSYANSSETSSSPSSVSAAVAPLVRVLNKACASAVASTSASLECAHREEREVKICEHRRQCAGEREPAARASSSTAASAALKAATRSLAALMIALVLTLCPSFPPPSTLAFASSTAASLSKQLKAFCAEADAKATAELLTSPDDENVPPVTVCPYETGGNGAVSARGGYAMRCAAVADAAARWCDATCLFLLNVSTPEVFLDVFFFSARSATSTSRASSAGSAQDA